MYSRYVLWSASAVRRRTTRSAITTLTSAISTSQTSTPGVSGASRTSSRWVTTGSTAKPTPRKMRVGVIPSAMGNVVRPLGTSP